MREKILHAIKMKKLLVILILGLFFCNISFADNLKVVDGDTIKIGRIRIRLHGIDAPESKQMCSSDGKQWRCGWEATNALANIVGKHWVTCIKTDVDRFKRIVAICRLGPINLNAWMVENGWAVAYRRYSLDYIKEEEVSRASARGLWRGKFIMPWDWRRSR